MKRLLLWLIGVALGVVVLLAAVLGVSYSFTSEGAVYRQIGHTEAFLFFQIPHRI